MNRTAKKCFVFSVCVHVALLGILIFSSAFVSMPAKNDSDFQRMTLIPANIIDASGAGGGGGAPLVSPPTERPAPPHTVPPTPVPAQEPITHQVPHQAPPVHHPKPPPPPEPETKQAEALTHVEHTVPRHQPTPDPQPDQETGAEVSMEPAKPRSPPKRSGHHNVEVKPTFGEISLGTSKPVKSSKPVVTSLRTTLSSGDGASSEAAARAEAAARGKALEAALDGLASGVKTSTGSTDISKDLAGVGGGDAFAGYGDVVKAIYRNAWITPDEGIGNTSWPQAKVIIGRDGSIRSAALVRSSGSRALDRTVTDALRLVQKVPPFPAGAHDSERMYIIEFNLESKKS